jgi:hypothetical protein
MYGTQSFFLWNLKVHYYVYRSQRLAPILSLDVSTHKPTLYLFMIHFNIILQSMPRSSKSD